MRIRVPRVAELPTLQAIERAAGLMFCEIGMPEIAQYDPWPLPVMTGRRQAGRLWVAANDDDEPVAYLMADLVDGCLQIEQVTVHPGSARRGLGRALLEHAANQAAADGLPALTLTTFAHVPWNAPYYARCGFRVLADGQITPGLQAIRKQETMMGLDRWPRVCMRRDLLRSGQGARTRRQSPAPLQYNPSSSPGNVAVAIRGAAPMRPGGQVKRSSREAAGRDQGH